MAELGGFVGRFQVNARSAPERAAIVFHRDPSDGDAGESMSYGELDRAAQAMAARLQEGCRPGDRVLLQFPPGLEFAIAFLGCQYAGIAPVPTPLFDGRPNQVDRTSGIVTDAEVSAVLTDQDNFERVSGWAADSGASGLTTLVAETSYAADTAGAESWAPPEIRPDTLAFLQYTSGSTSDPKGVMVAHENLVHNLPRMAKAFGFDPNLRLCSWLPTFHDMGLVIGMMGPLYLNGTMIMMSPVKFVQRPFSWLQLISRYKAHASPAPNFAYDLCARRLTDEQVATLDLSEWVSAVNGSEPIDAAVLERFATRFAPVGFRPESFRSGYGMAETVVFVAGSYPGKRTPVAQVDASALAKNRMEPAVHGADSLPVVSCGQAHEFDARVVEPETGRVLPDGQVGELWLRGQSVARGYWRKDEENERVFAARTTDGEGPFLRTGDLAAFQDGELYITGRLKEMLIVNGRNLYPQDIEREVKELHDLFQGRICSVFSVSVPEEQLVVVLELGVPDATDDDLHALAVTVKNGLGRRLGARVPNVVFVPRGGVRRTTSGKIQRRAMHDLFADGALSPLYEELDPAVDARYRSGAR